MSFEPERMTDPDVLGVDPAIVAQVRQGASDNPDVHVGNTAGVLVLASIQTGDRVWFDEAATTLRALRDAAGSETLTDRQRAVLAAYLADVASRLCRPRQEQQ